VRDRETLAFVVEVLASSAVAVLLVLAIQMVGHGQATSELPLLRQNFVQAAPQGFGDRQNSWPWSMIWWQGKLYVGTNRSQLCFQAASNAYAFPWLSYPPDDPHVECAAEPEDLELQAEIWRWTPETDTWERVYQSPNDIEIPDHPGKYVARDVGYRYMAVFSEVGGTEALYVSGVSARSYIKGIPPPRILRSTDGVTFEPIPQDPGTFLGDLDTLDGIDMNSFRALTVYEGRLYATVGRIYGNGVVLEAENPAGGNDNFRQISPPGMTVFEMVPYNGFLYVGTTDLEHGYSVLKTDASGEIPYSFIPIVTDGGFRQPRASGSVLSMFVFKDRLYVGTDRPAELIRINPDDSWDLIVGTPRDTPDGRKEPLSGMGDGFDFWLNGHIWRMGEYGGWLYVGTWDMSTLSHAIPWLEPILGPHMGFDMYATWDGEHFTMITRDGFGDIFNYGVRTLQDTPYGLFLGTANPYYGLQIWRGVPGETYPVYLPLVSVSASETTMTRLTR
jgi:hypothetical protein